MQISYSNSDSIARLTENWFVLHSFSRWSRSSFPAPHISNCPCPLLKAQVLKRERKTNPEVWDTKSMIELFKQSNLVLSAEQCATALRLQPPILI